MRASLALLLLLCCAAHSAMAQSRYADRTFEVGANHRQSGWLIGLGVNTMWARDLSNETILNSNEESPVEYLANIDGKGKIGLYVELGRFNIFENGFFDFMDYGIAYRQETGEEVMDASLVRSSAVGLPDLALGQGSFSQDHLRAFFNLNKGIPLKGHWFVQQAIGIDVEYRLINNADYAHNTFVTDSLGATGFNFLAPSESLSAHLHYKAGIGYKTSPGGWLLLSAETPIQTLVPFDGVVSRQTIFNTKYRPVVISLRYMWASKRPDRECSPVGKGPKKLKKKARRKGKGRGLSNGQLG